MHHNLESKFPHCSFRIFTKLLDERLDHRFSVFTCTIIKKNQLKQQCKTWFLEINV